MLKALREKYSQKRTVWSNETAERMEAYAASEQIVREEQKAAEEEQNHLLYSEMEKYLYTIHPSFLLNTGVARALHNRLLARSQGKFSISLHVTSEMRLALDFYNTDLSIFIRLLEKKGYSIKNKEEQFMTVLLNMLSENNYRMFLDRYGDFADAEDSLEAAIYNYLEMVDNRSKYESGRMDFLNKYLINKRLLSSSYTKRKLIKLIKSFEKEFKEDYKMNNMEKRMRGIS